MNGRRFVRKRFGLPAALALLILVVCYAASAQMQLGSLMLFYLPTAPLLLSALTQNPPNDGNFMQGTGGVAFWGTASSADGAKVASLEYNPWADDGKRLEVRLAYPDGRKLLVTAPIYDWQLRPIAAYAQGPGQAAFTFAGKLSDIMTSTSDPEARRLASVLGNPGSAEELESRFASREGRIAKYHPAFESTLLGLRLMEGDILVLYRDAGYLPAGPNGAPGESTEPHADPQAGIAAFNSADLTAFRRRWFTDRAFNGYIICDANRKVTFQTQDGSLSLNGSPYWYCWKMSQAGDPMLQQQDSDRLNAAASTIQRINPAVYDALRTTMQYADFFRTARADIGAQAYQRFLTSLPAPRAVQTPTVVMDSQ